MVDRLQYTPVDLTESEFKQFQSFIYDVAGIDLHPRKIVLVNSRLSKRLRHYGLKSFSAYFDLISGSQSTEERQLAINLLTTNETYFFREQEHFDFLSTQIVPNIKFNQQFRVWSAASSSGEEAYSIAMVLADKLSNNRWEISGSDINSQVLDAARQGHYRMDRIDGIPKQYLKAYCLRGTDEHEGSLLIDPKLRQKINFFPANLLSLPKVEPYDLIFLRNVLIYFDNPTKEKIIAQLYDRLLPNAFLFIGHSESLKMIETPLKLVKPSIYQKVS
jgi:chemotaxis protein methyltransferase CheR